MSEDDDHQVQLLHGGGADPNDPLLQAISEVFPRAKIVGARPQPKTLAAERVQHIPALPPEEVPPRGEMEHENTGARNGCSSQEVIEEWELPDFLRDENTGTPGTPDIVSLREEAGAKTQDQDRQVIEAGFQFGRVLTPQGVPGVVGVLGHALVEEAKFYRGLGKTGSGTPAERSAVTGVPEPGYISFGPFHSNHRGLFQVSEAKDEKPVITKISGPVRTVALSREIDGTNWGLVIEVPNYDGEWRQIVVPRDLLAGNGDALRALLMSMGFHVATQKRSRDALMSFFEQVFDYVSPRRTSVNSVGWHGGEYVTPGQVYTPRQTSDLVLSSKSSAARMLAMAGTLDSWRDNVGRFAVGNSRLMLVLGAAFAAPLLQRLGIQGGGVHLRGGSSTGKTTLLRAATSVYSQQDYQMTWRQTDNGLEGIAAARNDGLLVLDEMGQVAASKVGEAIYMLANGEGKTRADKWGEARLPKKFRIMLLSTGEISLADKIAEDRFSRTRIMAGQEVRLLDLPADTGQHGAFEQLHGFADGASLAGHLNSTVQVNHGTAFDAFMRRLVKFGAGDWQRLEALLLQRTAEMVAGLTEGQLQRAAERFAVISLGAELASEFGVGPWSTQDAANAMRICFEAWVSERGGTRSIESMQTVGRIRDFISKNISRFEDVFEHDDPVLASGQRAVKDRAGFVLHQVAGGPVYGFTSGGYKEALGGLNGTLAAQNLAERGYLQGPDGKGKWSFLKTVGGQKFRLYMVNSSILEAE